MNLNNKQKTVLTIALVVFVACTLYPPWVTTHLDSGVEAFRGYSHIFDSRTDLGWRTIAYTQLLLQWVAVAVSGFVLILLLRNDARRCWLRLLLVVTGVCILVGSSVVFTKQEGNNYPKSGEERAIRAARMAKPSFKSLSATNDGWIQRMLSLNIGFLEVHGWQATRHTDNHYTVKFSWEDNQGERSYVYDVNLLPGSMSVVRDIREDDRDSIRAREARLAEDTLQEGVAR